MTTENLICFAAGLPAGAILLAIAANVHHRIRVARLRSQLRGCILFRWHT
jgi:hypothetical protein